MPKTAEIARDILIQTALQNMRADARPKKRLFGVVIRWSKGVILPHFPKHHGTESIWRTKVLLYSIFRREKHRLSLILYTFFKLENIEKSFKDDSGYSNQIKFLSRWKAWCFIG